MVRDEWVQNEVAKFCYGLVWRMHNNIGRDARRVLDLAGQGECTGDYVSDLVSDVRELSAYLADMADTLDGLRVQLDAESFTMMKVQAVADRAAVREFTKRVKG
jgi:hypothetical protein